MENASERLKSLRLRAGLATESLADQIGISAEWYEDLELEDGELEETLDLDQIRKLSLLLSVGVWQLLTGSPLPPATTPLSFRDLARHIRRGLESLPSLEALEEKIGWDLSAFLKSPDIEGLGQRTGFFKDVCAALDLDWRGIVAYCEALGDSGE